MKKFILFLVFLLVLSGCKEVHVSEDNSFVLKNLHLIDVINSRVEEVEILVIEDGLISYIGEAKEPANYEVHDLKGAFVMPGLINSHVHSAYDEGNLQRWLISGVTTVRDLGSRTVHNYSESRDELRNNISLTKIISATPIITKPGGYGYEYVDGVADVKKVMEKHIEKGADIIKISIESDFQGRKLNILTAEEIDKVVGMAKENSLRTVAHCIRSYNALLAIDNGVSEFAHMLVDPLDDEIIDAIIKNEVFITPTLELWKGVSEKHNIIWLDVAISNLRRFYTAGGKISFGTDFDGYSTSFDKGLPITEIKLMQKAGMTNIDIIKSATINAAIVCGIEESLGSLEKGKLADILVVRTNPMENIESLLNIEMIIHQGHIVKYE